MYSFAEHEIMQYYGELVMLLKFGDFQVLGKRAKIE
jgi:hypothetical protein